MRDLAAAELQMVLVKGSLPPAKGCSAWKPEYKVTAGSSVHVTGRGSAEGTTVLAIWGQLRVQSWL